MQRFGKRPFVAFLVIVILTAVGGYSSGWFVPTETTVTEIAPGVWFRKTQWEPKFIGCNQGWIIFDDFVLVIDANFPNQAEEIIPPDPQDGDRRSQSSTCSTLTGTATTPTGIRFSRRSAPQRSRRKTPAKNS